MPRNVTTPVGRLVQGDCFNPSTTDQQGAALVVKTGPNAGQPRADYFIAVAFAKTDPAWPAYYAELDAEARAAWPNLFPTPGGPCVIPTFAYKVIDGDGYDTLGKSNALKEGFAGHWIVRFSSGYAPKVVRPTAPGVWSEVTNPGELKRGYFVRVASSIKGNDNPQKPGLYLNYGLVEIVAHGAEIITGPSASDAFGAPAALPPGASPIPVAPVGMPPAPPAPPAPVAPPPAPPAPVAPPPPPPAPVRVMLPAAGGATYESFIAAGWTDETLIAHGKMQG